MTESAESMTTELLRRAAAGDETAFAEAVALLNVDLERLARWHLGRKRFGKNATMEPSSLVQRTFLKILRSGQPFQDRAHLIAAASRIMLHVLIDYERARLADKRGGDQLHLSVSGIASPQAVSLTTAVALKQALESLEEQDPRKGNVARMKTLWGFSHAEIAELLGVSTPTVERDWRFARAWLARKLKTGA